MITIPRRTLEQLQTQPAPSQKKRQGERHPAAREREEIRFLCVYMCLGSGSITMAYYNQANSTGELIKSHSCVLPEICKQSHLAS